jgi:hypothetical protein
MFLKGLPIIVGISLLCGVISCITFMETRYFQMKETPREISQEEYKMWKENNPITECINCSSGVVEKKFYNYELGSLTAVSVFAGLLILNGLRKGKKNTSEN